MSQTQPDVVARAEAIAAKARANAAPIAREWWLVTQGDIPKEVYFCPPQTHSDVIDRWYPGAGVVAI